jgi:hypothetical protein
MNTTSATTELLLLPNGQILVHNLTPVMAALLAEFNPADEPMRERVTPPERPPVAGLESVLPASSPSRQRSLDSGSV